MAYSDDNNTIVCGATDGSVVILTVAETLSQRTLLQPHIHEIQKVLVVKSPSNAGTLRQWMSVGVDGCISVGQLSTIETFKTIQFVTNPFAISGSALCEDTLAPRAVAILARQGVELWSVPEPNAIVETQQQQQQQQQLQPPLQPPQIPLPNNPNQPSSSTSPGPSVAASTSNSNYGQQQSS